MIQVTNIAKIYPGFDLDRKESGIALWIKSLSRLTANRATTVQALSGAILPAWIRPVSLAIPHTYALQGIRRVMINGAGFGDPATRNTMLVLVLFYVVFVSLGIFLLNKALHKAERTNGVGIVV